MSDQPKDAAAEGSTQTLIDNYLAAMCCGAAPRSKEDIARRAAKPKRPLRPRFDRRR